MSLACFYLSVFHTTFQKPSVSVFCLCMNYSLSNLSGFNCRLRDLHFSSYLWAVSKFPGQVITFKRVQEICTPIISLQVQTWSQLIILAQARSAISGNLWCLGHLQGLADMTEDLQKVLCTSNVHDLSCMWHTYFT